VGDLFRVIVVYLEALVVVIGAALRLDPTVYEVVAVNPMADWIVVGIAFLAGVSTLLGQSFILFVNRVRRGRFFASLIVNGLLFIVQFVIWGLVIAFIGNFLFPVAVDMSVVVRVVGLSMAPLVFGFLILIPHIGPYIGNLLNVWVLLILIVVVEVVFATDFVSAVIGVGAGWLVTLVMAQTVGRPIVALRDFIMRKVTGSSLKVTPLDILLDFQAKQGDIKPAHGSKP